MGSPTVFFHPLEAAVTNSLNNLGFELFSQSLLLLAKARKLDSGTQHSICIKIIQAATARPNHITQKEGIEYKLKEECKFFAIKLQ